MLRSKRLFDTVRPPKVPKVHARNGENVSRADATFCGVIAVKPWRILPLQTPFMSKCCRGKGGNMKGWLRLSTYAVR